MVPFIMTIAKVIPSICFITNVLISLNIDNISLKGLNFEEWYTFYSQRLKPTENTQKIYR